MGAIFALLSGLLLFNTEHRLLAGLPPPPSAWAPGVAAPS